MNQSGKIHFDEAPNKLFSYPQDFSQKRFKDFLRAANINASQNNQDLLINLNLATQEKTQLVLNNAGVLFFAEDPQKFFPESYLTAVCYRTADRFSVMDKKDFYGDPITQIEDALNFIQKHIAVAFDINAIGGSLGQRTEIFDYPIIALREAVINAVTHRDYQYDGSHIYIHIFPEHIDIENPGGLFHGLTEESLGKRSVRRNRLIAELLHRAKYIERIGSGFARMQYALKENNNPALEITTNNFFNIRFFKRVPDPALLSLTPRQRSILNYLGQYETLGKREVATLLQVSDDTALREIRALIDAGFVSTEGIGRATKYRKNQ